ncbi:MAG: hypothetical protein E6R03_15855 [Hyphomicrobiaceae bacterium]|nr:hypothetical protein [Anaerolineae bacterium]TXH10092.1 MAG: hypothetical protein E6R03_15855 [Hyphomicrobiaceae bacterium]
MISDIFPTVYLVVLVELLFGIGYDQVVKWAHANNAWHVSISVIIGVFVTCALFVGFMFDKVLPVWVFGLVLVACFSASGLPMAVGSLRRDVKDKKKKRPLGKYGAKIRDEVTMELNVMASELSEQVKADTLSVRDLPDIVNRLHHMKSMLKMM